MQVLIPLTIIILLNIFTVTLSNKNFGKCLPITQCVIITTLFLSQLLSSTFTLGYFLIILLTIASIIITLLKWKKIKPNVISVGFIMFIAIAVFFGIIDYGRTFSDVDEFWHWGMMVKEMLRLDSFYCASDSHMIIHKDYPPFPALYEMFWCTLSGGYSESISTFALHLLSFSFLLCPFIEDLPSFRLDIFSENSNNFFYKAKNIMKISASAFIIILLFGLTIALCDGSHSFNKILTDIPLAIFFSYSLYNAYFGNITNTKFDYISLLATLIMLTMTKQIGFELSLITVMSYALITFYCNLNDNINLKNKFIKTLSLIITPYLFKFSWDTLVKYLHVTDIRSLGDGVGQFDSNKFVLSKYVQAMNGSNTDLMTQTMNNLKIAFLTRNVLSVPNVNISFIAIIILIVILTIGFLFYKNSILDKKQVSSLLLTLVLGTLGFMLLLTVAFCFGFTDDEMEELRGYERYVDSYVIGLVILMFQAYILQFFTYSSNMKTITLQPVKKLVLTLLILLTFYLSTERYDFIPQINYRKTNQWAFAETDITPNVTENSNVGIILCRPAKTVQWLDECMLQYYINKASVNVIEFDEIDLSDDATADRIIQFANQSDYFYVSNNQVDIYEFIKKHSENAPILLTNE